MNNACPALYDALLGWGLAALLVLGAGAMVGGWWLRRRKETRWTN